MDTNSRAKPKMKNSWSTVIITSVLVLIYFLNHHHHHSNHHLNRLSKQRAIRPTLAQLSISNRLSQEWLSTGRLLSPLSTPSQPIDLVWTWANHSKPREDQGILTAATQYLYREHDELRFSLRSSLISLPPQFIRSRQIITSSTRPHWLASSHPTLSFILHSHLFKFIDHSKILLSYQWFKHYVPSLNSLAIESQFGHLSTIHDNFLYLNDDCFFINKFSQGDFSSELFGPVFRIQFDLKVEDDQINRSGSLASRGEWPSLGYSNYLLSERFGKRDRRYLSHLPKVLNIHILNEVSEIWREEIFITASSRVRGQRRELNMMYLSTWYHIEKHREAMLHSFIMLQSDQNQDGMMTRKEREGMMKRIGTGDEEVIEVYKPFRPRRGIVEDGLRDSAPLETDYEWISSDGYPLIGPNMKELLDYRHQEIVPRIICRLNLTHCFPPPLSTETFSSTEKILGRIAHEKPECGDCLLALLIGQQSTGIESLLPPRTFRTSIAEWLDSNILATRPFSSFNKLAHGLCFFEKPFIRSSRFHKPTLFTHDPRIWAIRNIQRYQYVLGNTPSRFDVLTTLPSSRKLLTFLSQKFTKKDGFNRALLVTINDRIFTPHLAHVHKLFVGWLNQSWPFPAPWENNP
ncbi:hypothetical protein MJO29_012627 [Puccinia striiformis f. sp. tritici]|nr:hypothetical protein Pst134EB_024769 [Puccinia striiformis f. sp. tritici]KAI7942783.1 hypothetical protein MJO29_012627 [Puccinia striiformis f. sp. tritici]